MYRLWHTFHDFIPNGEDSEIQTTLNFSRVQYMSLYLLSPGVKSLKCMQSLKPISSSSFGYN